VKLPKDANKLVELLQHDNSWVRAKAQQLLVDGRRMEAEPLLRNLLNRTDKPLPLIHSFWTLEGLGLLQPADVIPMLTHQDWTFRMQALSVVPSVINKQSYGQFLPPLQQLINGSDTLSAPYIAFLTHSIQTFDPLAAKQLLTSLIKKYPNNLFVADAVISNMYNKENAFYKELVAANPDTTIVITKQVKKVLDNIVKAKNNANIKELQKKFPKGVAIFQSTCQTCHGADGNGVRSLGPPINNSDWVVGDKNKLIPIVLYGLTGPIKVKGKVYTAPEINGDMPAIGQNKEFTDEDISQVLNYIRNAWSNKASPIFPSDVTSSRNRFKGREKPFTMDELNRLK
jgi:mono/diheme cytochrome c family protein